MFHSLDIQNLSNCCRQLVWSINFTSFFSLIFDRFLQFGTTVWCRRSVSAAIRGIRWNWSGIFWRQTEKLFVCRRGFTKFLAWFDDIMPIVFVVVLDWVMMRVFDESCYAMVESGMKLVQQQQQHTQKHFGFSSNHDLNTACNNIGKNRRKNS